MIRSGATGMLARWLVYHLASGQSFFTGAACLLVAVCLTAVTGRRRVRLARNALVFVGILLVVLSATPLPPALAVLLFLASLLWLAGEASARRVPARGLLGLR